MSSFEIGGTPSRLEDERFLRGQGRYLDDASGNGTASMVIVRSPHAHALIAHIDATAARAADGVLAVLTSAELALAGMNPLQPSAQPKAPDGQPFPFEPQPLLAVDRVRHVGEAVAIVIGETLAAAQGGAEALDVDYRPMQAITTIEQATAPDAIRISDLVPDNRCLDTEVGDRDAVSRAFETAAHVVEMRTHNHRVITNAMETRGATGLYNSADASYRLDISSQNVHGIRDSLAQCLGVAAGKLRLVAPDVGGGFGNRNFVYAEYALVLWAAKVVGRPVRWRNTRSEGFCSDHQARDFLADAALALDEQGHFVGLRVASTANLGAYVAGAGCVIQTFQYPTTPGGLYRIPAVHLEIGAVITNTVPIGVTRGPGFAEAIHVIERLIDLAAQRLGLDRMTLRRRNLVGIDDMPWTNSVGTRIDSGDFLSCFERALENADYANLDSRRNHAAAKGRLRGFGLACHVKATGGPPEENVSVQFESDQIVFTTGTMAIGQGHETSFRQILGSLLGLRPEQIVYRAGDTSLIAMGGGHGSSRATYMASTAMARAVQDITAKGREFLADAFGVPIDAVEFADGVFAVRNANRQIPLLDAAAMLRDAGASLDTYSHIVREAMTFPGGCHAAEVDIDPETGHLQLVRYTAVDDYGVIVNPMLVQGQMHGAIAQGAGQALLEAAVYDPDSGQLLSGSFMDYAMPRADDLPSFDTEIQGTPCTTNPLGIKGCGEAGAVAGFPAIGNAIADALERAGASYTDGPATPERLWRALHDASTSGPA